MTFLFLSVSGNISRSQSFIILDITTNSFYPMAQQTISTWNLLSDFISILQRMLMLQQTSRMSSHRWHFGLTEKNVWYNMRSTSTAALTHLSIHHSTFKSLFLLWSLNVGSACQSIQPITVCPLKSFALTMVLHNLFQLYHVSLLNINIPNTQRLKSKPPPTQFIFLSPRFWSFIV